MVGSDGFFGTTAPLPPRRFRFTDKASYRASIGTLRSPYLKLNRRVLVISISSSAGKVVLRGRVIKPLARPIARILVQRRLSCSSTVTLRRIKPRRNGSFTVTLVAPPRIQAAVYLATTQVRQTARKPKKYRVSTPPRVVVLQ